MDTAAVTTSAREFTGKLAISLIQKSLQAVPEGSSPAGPAVPGKGTRIDVRV